MKHASEVEILGRLIVQLKGLHSEISQLTKKSPNDAVNSFKLKLINKVLASGNEFLGPGYRPFGDFDQFDSDDVPTNSDVTLILTQYIEQAERFRSDNIQYFGYKWVYTIDGKPSNIETAQPTLIGDKK